MIKGILFDKDGTLIDFNATWLAAYIRAANTIAESVGQPGLADSLLRSGGYDRVTGQWEADSLLASGSNRQILDFWSQQLGQPLTGSRLAAIRDIFSRAANNPTPAIGNLREFLLGLKARGLQSGLATMDDERNAIAMIEKFDLVDCFDFVCGADSGYGEKPEPGMVEAFCHHCQLRPDQVIMVGDSPKDIHMGIHAGVARAIGVLTGSHNRHELGKHTDTVLDNIAELENLLNDLKPPPDPASYCKPDRKTLRARLNDIQYRVTQQDATERPFDNQYNDEKREGIYVDIVSGEPLFSSTDKFDSGTGWPSFSRPLHPHCVVEKTDYQLFMRRTEVRSRHADSHLGHVFPDGPAPTGLRYCMNSAALRFIPKESMQAENYGQYLSLFEPASPEKAVPNTGPAPAHKED